MTRFREEVVLTGRASRRVADAGYGTGTSAALSIAARHDLHGRMSIVGESKRTEGRAG
jgi:hypothetical protein